MRTYQKSARGQALIIFVFALIGLIAITGLAIDGGMIFSDRRHAQNAADTAAMAGALAKIDEMKVDGHTSVECSEPVPPATSSCWSQILIEAKNRASSNGYTGNLVDSTVQVHIPPISGPYSDCSSYQFHCEDYIQVIIDSNINTFFAKIIGITQMHNHVEAVALANYAPESGLFGGNSLVTLRPTSNTCDGEFSISGDSTINLNGGGIFVNSDNTSCAFKYPSGCATINLTNGATINVVGGVAAPSDATCTMPPYSHPPDQIPFPPEPLFDEPVQCTWSGSSYVAADGVHYRPGYYNKLPPENDVTLDPGVYCVETLVKSINPTRMRGNGVFLYIRDSGQATAFSFQGGTVTLTAPGATADADTLPYKGFLIYVASTYTGNPKSCIINAGSDDTFTGVIYAPYCDVTINGQSDSVGISAQIVSYTMKINGNGVMNYTYDPSLMPQIPEKRDTGLYR